MKVSNSPTPPSPPGFAPDIHFSSLDCVHCGLCLSTCPTYLVTGRESASPRGRVYMMRGVAEGEIELSERVADELHLCLGCRACETACPSGVAYGSMLESARASIAEAGVGRGLAPKLERFVLRHVVRRPGRLSVLMNLMSLVQRLGLHRLAARILPPSLAKPASLLPAIPPAAERRPLPVFTPAREPRRGRVALLEGCVMPELFGAVNRDTVAVLAHVGFDVWVPPKQSCCGALHAHAGDAESAREQARLNIRAFDVEGGEPLDAVVVNSAGCGAAMRELEQWFGPASEGAASAPNSDLSPDPNADPSPDSNPARAAARALSSRVRDVSEFLDEVGLRGSLAPTPQRVCYDDPCHLVHGQGVAAAPRRLLASIPGLELVQHADPDACCGAAGTYNLTQPAMAEQVLAKKLDALATPAPDAVATGNPGCMMQIAGGLEQRGLDIEVVHPVQLLARAYGLTQD